MGVVPCIHVLARWDYFARKKSVRPWQPLRQTTRLPGGLPRRRNRLGRKVHFHFVVHSEALETAFSAPPSSAARARKAGCGPSLQRIPVLSYHTVRRHTPTECKLAGGLSQTFQSSIVCPVASVQRNIHSSETQQHPGRSKGLRARGGPGPWQRL